VGRPMMVHSPIESHVRRSLKVRVCTGDGGDLGVIEIMTIVIVEVVIMTVDIVGVLHGVLYRVPLSLLTFLTGRGWAVTVGRAVPVCIG